MGSTGVCYIAGVCLNSGTPQAKAGVGGWFGDDRDKCNFSVNLPGKQTEERAQIHAAIEAVRRGQNQGWSSITVFTDYNQLHIAYKDMDTWDKQNWLTQDGKPLPNQRDFLELFECKKTPKIGLVVSPIPVIPNSGIPAKKHAGKEKAIQLANKAANKP